MGMNSTGFIVGLLVARQQNLPSSSAVSIGLLSSMFGGNNAMGIVMASVLAQRQAASSAGPTPPPATTGGALPPPVTPPVTPPPPKRLDAPAAVSVRAGGNLAHIEWTKVDGATKYAVRRHHHGSPTKTIVSEIYGLVCNDEVPSGAEAKNYRYEVAAEDAAGNLSDWSAGTHEEIVTGKSSK